MSKNRFTHKTLGLLVFGLIFIFVSCVVAEEIVIEKTATDAEGCVESAAGPVAKNIEIKKAMDDGDLVTFGPRAKVGHEAPDFEATAYLDGGFTKVKLSDYRDKWVVLCFYPGDFTFV